MPLTRSYQEFFEAGVGAYMWSTDDHGLRVLWLLTPDTHVKAGAVPSMLYMEHDPSNWATPGTVKGWDGNEESPTLYPSIVAGLWHGFLRNGQLVEAG